MGHEIPPKELWNLGILTDTGVCSSYEETKIFIKGTDREPKAFDHYCVFDVTLGMYRILVEADTPRVGEQ